MNNEDETKLKNLIIRHEGFRTHIYLDSVGKLTIGVGHNLTDLGLTSSQVNLIFEDDLQRAIDDVESIFPGFKEFSEARRAALIDMIFNLGKTRFLEFKKMIEAIKNEDWRKASDEMLDSAWATQVPLRAAELARMVKFGTWDNEK